jgi:hypothetical protein
MRIRESEIPRILEQLTPANPKENPPA